MGLGLGLGLGLRLRLGLAYQPLRQKVHCACASLSVADPGEHGRHSGSPPVA